MNMDRLKQQMAFMQEIDKLKNIRRQSYIIDGKRNENDAEHSWHLAMMTMLLSEYSNEKIDVLRVMSMVLIHDLVEIDAGDTYAYDIEGNKTKRIREEKAADRIFNILPQDQAKYMRELWEEFELGETSEARFANAIDRVQPIMLNASSGGKAWEEHKVQLSQVLERNEKVENGSKELWEFAKEFYIEPNVSSGKIL